MEHPSVSTEEMRKRIVRFDDLKGNGIPLMFTDSILDGHQRMNYAIVGDTASENPEFQPLLPQPHKFQIGMFNCPPGSGPAYHNHDYVEVFLTLSGKWRFYWGNDPSGPEEETTLSAWDLISFPAGLWRGFENVGEEPAWGFAVLDPHDVFVGQDPHWPAWVAEHAKDHGLTVDENGKMIRPPNYEELKSGIEKNLRSQGVKR